MPTTRQAIVNVLVGQDFSDGEKFVLKNQFPGICFPSNFEQKLWELICASDENNKIKLVRAFPDETNAVIDWTSGSLGQKFRRSGLEI